MLKLNRKEEEMIAAFYAANEVKHYGARAGITGANRWNFNNNNDDEVLLDAPMGADFDDYNDALDEDL